MDKLQKLDKLKNNQIVFQSNKVDKTKHSFLLILFMGVFIGFINGFFGGGGGMICVPILIHFFKLQDKQSHATTIFIILFTSLSSIFIYMSNLNVFNLDNILIIIGFTCGGFIGAKLLTKLNNNIIRIIFVVIILISGVRMVL